MSSGNPTKPGLPPRESLFSRITSSFNLRLRLAILCVLVFGATTLAFNGILFTHTLETLQSDFDDALYNYTIDVSESIALGPKGDLTFPPLQVDDGKILPFPLGTALIQVRHISGKILSRVGDFGGWDPPYKTDFSLLRSGEEATFRTIQDVHLIPNAEAESYRMISFPLDSSSKTQLILQIAVPMTLLETQLVNRLRMLQWGIPTVLLIAVLGGYFLAGRALRPVQKMIQTAEAIDASELDQRVPVPHTNDEIKRLALTLNDMLNRIEKAFRTQERFIADASHQLMTPLAILKTDLELLRKEERTPARIEEFMENSRQEIENLTKILRDMLVLARVDAGLGALILGEVYLDEAVLDTIARVEKIARAKNVRLTADFNGEQFRRPIRADRDLLQNLLVNIVENAIKYSPENTLVRVELEWAADFQEIRIRDQGPGIAEAELPRIFERFARAPNAALHGKGFGLGLAIAKQIAHLHHASLTAQNQETGGTSFHFKMPNTHHS
ncbi:MAG: HAMP domain-containing protein [Bdellovibrionaceae bacterium]|nr:HAMP domain-containing protein [Pseudobdellovibrionaceae bacterium]